MNRITVTIAGREYNLTSTDSEEHVLRVAEYVNEKIREGAGDSKDFTMAGAVLSALNIADEYLKNRDIVDGLRQQVKDILEDSSKTRAELAECRRELSRIKRRD